MAFIDTRLSTNVAAGFSGGPERSTRVKMLDNGRERRNAQWAYPRHHFTAQYSTFSTAEKNQLLVAIQATQGQLHAFRFKDHNDYQVTAQALGAAPSGSTPVQLVKSYAFGSESTSRLVQAPNAIGFTMYEDTGSGPVAKAGALDTTTGLFTPTAPWGTLTTPAISSVTTATVGGTLASGTKSYRVAATSATGVTLASVAGTVVTTGATSTTTVNWAGVAGATGYKVYGRTGGAELLIATVGLVTAYTDTGSVTPAGALPAANTTIPALSWTGEFDVWVRFASDRAEFVSVTKNIWTTNVELVEVLR